MRRHPKKIRPYKNQFILKVPVAEEFDYPKRENEDDPVTVGDDIEALQIQFLGQMAGTTDNAGKKLVHGIGFCNRGDLTSMIATHLLDWTVSVFEGEKIIQNRVLSHLLPDIVTDENGENPVEVPITDCTDRLSCVAGKSWRW